MTDEDLWCERSGERFECPAGGRVQAHGHRHRARRHDRLAMEHGCAAQTCHGRRQRWAAPGVTQVDDRITIAP